MRNLTDKIVPESRIKTSMTYEDFENRVAEARNSLTYENETVVMDFTEEICGILIDKKMTKTDLAIRIGKSHKLIDSILSGNHPIVVKDMVEIAYHLGYRIKFKLEPIKEQNKVKED